jgi:vitamin B12 transporter
MQLHSLPAAVALLGSLPIYSMTASAAEFDSVVVTATRTAQTMDDSLAAVTVITRAEIEQLQSQSLQELLRGVVGLTIANNGGAGKHTAVFMRGTESDHVLVLVDGVKVGSATTGGAACQDIPVAQIERIEIVRGPRSSLYGAEAIGGVIQIFTRKGMGEIKPSFSVGAGSYGTYSAQAGVAGGSEQSWFSANLHNINTKGFNACKGSLSAGCFTVNPDKDGYHNSAASLRAGQRFANGVEAELNALRSEGDNSYDGSFVNESSSVQQVLGGKVSAAPISIWQTTLAAGQSLDHSDNFRDGAFMSRFNTRRDSASWQNDITIGDGHLLTVGLDRLVDRVESNTVYAINSRGNTALFTQYQGAVGVVDMQASLRRDDNEQFGNHGTGGVAFGTNLGNNLRGTLSYGTAFKAPTFNELYYPGYGNANLKPEESRSVEIGVAGKTTSGHWALNAYETRIDNLIAYDASLFAPNNLDQARIHGLEAVCGVDMSGWAVNANLTLLDPENRATGSNYGKVLPRRAKTAYRLDADRTLGAYQLGASLRAEGHRYDNLSNSRRLGGYATIDLRTGYDLAKAWQLQGRIENLLDKGYETAAFYNQPGRSLFVTLRYQP